jgi:hypothetical protein
MRLVLSLSSLGVAGLLLAGCTINGNPFASFDDGNGALLECVNANTLGGQLAG